METNTVENLEIDSSTINKITALMNLTDHRGASEHEAKNASALVMRLLAKYNLDLSEFDKIVNKKEEISKNNFENDGKSLPQWKTNLITAISRAHFCDVYISCGYRKRSHIVVGRSTNVQAVKIVYNFLCDVVETESKSAFEAYTGFEHGKSYIHSFKSGMVKRISERLEQECNLIQEDHVKAIGEKEPGREIVVSNIYEDAQKEIKEYYKSVGTKLRQSVYSGVNNSRAGFNNGLKAGENVPLHSSPSLKQRN